MRNMVRLGDTDLNVRQEGQGTPLLLVHGFPLDHTMWDRQVSELSTDYHVIVPDLRGFGASRLGSEPFSMARLADDLAAMLDELHVTQPVIFCGLSMGGYVAWQFWDRHADRLKKLILCDTRAAADTSEAAAGRRETAAQVLEDGPSNVVKGMLSKLFAKTTHDTAPEAVEAVRNVMEATDPKTIAAALLAMADRPNMEPRLKEVAVPTLVVCGEHDAITPAAEMRQMATAMPAARYEEIEAAGHMAPLEQPVAVNRAIREFLEQQP